MRTLPLASLVLVLLGGVVAAESGTVTILPGGRQDVLTLTLGSGETVDYSWTATGSVEFTIKRAVTDELVSTGQVGSGSFTAPSDGTYVFTFRNRTPTTTSVTWSVDRRAVSAGLWIFVALLAVLAALVAIGLWQRARRRRPWGPMPPQPPPPR